MRILGFDEAGRGSVLGPLVVGGFLMEAAEAEAVRADGGRDSKGMSHTQRVAAAERLRARAADWRTVHIEPAAIETGNLNALEEDAFAAITAALRPDVVHVDAPVPSARLAAYRAHLSELLELPQDRIEVANQAEDRYPAVGAASVLAKTERDAALAGIREEHGDVGSGYPSDPVTRAYLERMLRQGGPLPPFVRARWGTLQRLRERIEFGTQADLFGGSGKR